MLVMAITPTIRPTILARGASIGTVVAITRHAAKTKMKNLPRNLWPDGMSKCSSTGPRSFLVGMTINIDHLLPVRF
jgi:hypothetical protein